MGTVRKIVAGGQTGVDTAALRAGLRHGLQTGGWCPPDRRNEAGPIPGLFGLTQTPVERSLAASDVPRSLRTEWNVRDADATLLLLPGREGDPADVDPGTRWAGEVAGKLGKPLLMVFLGNTDATDEILSWLERIDAEVLNVAGPSEVTAPGVEAAAGRLLDAVFALRKGTGFRA